MSATNYIPAQHYHPSGHGAYPDGMASRDDTLVKISDIANDVEMLDAAEADPEMKYLVLDTNVLIHNLDVLRCFSEDLERLAAPMKIVVPDVVLSELDGLKKGSQSWFARTASTLLLQKVKEKRTWRVQKRDEKYGIELSEYERLRAADIAILDCALYYQCKGEVHLYTNDKNLTIDCLKEGCAVVKHANSSSQLAKAIWPDRAAEIPQFFRGHENVAKYRPPRAERPTRLARTEAPEEPVEEDGSDDGMEIDSDDGKPVIKDDTAVPRDAWVPSHALDGLHLQIIDHFSIVLKELASRVRHQAGEAGPPVHSLHAPAHRQKAFELWTVRDCLEYLGTKKQLQKSEPPLGRFLLRRNEERGWRRGQDWPRKAWDNALDALGDVGRQFGDELVVLSLRELGPHVAEVFNAPLRPTGS